MCADKGWSASQCADLGTLWQKESGWNIRAHNRSGAHGIPQALPGSKMASAGPNWQSNARTQIAWGLGYIAEPLRQPEQRPGPLVQHAAGTDPIVAPLRWPSTMGRRARSVR